MAVYVLNATGNWNSNSTWLPNTGFPGALDTAQIVGAYTLTINGNFTCADITCGTILGFGATIVLAGNLTVTNNINLTGVGKARPFIKSSGLGTARTITCNGVADSTTISGTDFQDINAQGSASWDFVDGSDTDPTRGTVGDCLGNIGKFVFPPSRDLGVKQLSATLVNYWSTNNYVDVGWYLVDGVTPSRIALAHDNVTILAVGSTRMFCIDRLNVCANFTSDLPYASCQVYVSDGTPTFYYGNFTFKGASGGVYGQGVTTLCGRGQHTIDIDTIVSTASAGYIINTIPGAGYGLLSDLNMTLGGNNHFTVTSGNFSTNGFTVTTVNLNATGNGFRVVDLRGSTLNLTYIAGSFILAFNYSANMTVFADNTIVNIDYNGLAGRPMSFGNYAWGYITIKAPPTALSQMTFNWGATFKTLTIISKVQTLIAMAAGMTINVLQKIQANGLTIRPVSGTTTTLLLKCPTPQTVTNCDLSYVTSVAQPLYAPKSINRVGNKNVNFYPLDTWGMAKTMAVWFPTLELSGTSSGSTNVSGSLLTTLRLMGTISGISTTSAVLTTLKRMIGQSSGVSTASAVLTTSKLLIASSNGNASATAALTTAKRLSASISGTSNAQATLVTIIRLIGASMGYSDFTAPGIGILITKEAVQIELAKIRTYIEYAKSR